ncbi:hypothetical protein GE061_002559 [Apolygus lucorum]|uniref:Uncharacterized protein n=1 Tax=Apolygus lucorum TaxID=248454 RepID=A0A6A4JJV2_APOLU|nr:hypothetical protein GE061_002559 [Apolygus lucorum]
MDVDGPDVEAKDSPNVDEGDSWSDTSGEYSVVSDGGASASAESTTEEVPKGKLESRSVKGYTPKRRFTHCPEKKNNSLHYFESCTRRAFKRGRHGYLRNKLETIFEHPVVTSDNKVLFLRQIGVNTHDRKFIRGRRFSTRSFKGILFRSYRRQAVKKSVEEVDQLMMNLDIQQENPVT